MGCGASKHVDRTVVKTVTERPTQENARIQRTAAETSDAAAKDTSAVVQESRPDMSVTTENRPDMNVTTESRPDMSVTTESQVVPKQQLEGKPGLPIAAASITNVIGASRGTLERAVMPEIRSSRDALTPQVQSGEISEKLKPVAFEIPVNELKPRKTSAPKSSLPKLELSEEEIKAKLSASEERWRDLEKEKEIRRSARSLAAAVVAAERGGSAKSNPEELKSKLEEKEAKAEQNRQRELAKRQNEQQKRDSRAREVQERKKQMQKKRDETGDQEEELDISWGGEAKVGDGDVDSQ